MTGPEMRTEALVQDTTTERVPSSALHTVQWQQNLSGLV